MGTSMIIVNNDRGAALVHDVQDQIFLEERSLSEALNG